MVLKKNSWRLESSEGRCKILVAQRLKRLPPMRETRVRSLGREDPLEKEMVTHSVFLPGESHGWRSLVGYSPRGRKESDTTERLHSTLYSLPWVLLAL